MGSIYINALRAVSMLFRITALAIVLWILVNPLNMPHHIVYVFTTGLALWAVHIPTNLALCYVAIVIHNNIRTSQTK